MFSSLFEKLMFEGRKKSKFSFFDKLVDLIGTEVIEVYNGRTYSGERNSRDGDGNQIDFDTDKWFKIRIGKYVSGMGDWGGGFERATCAVAEVFIDNCSNVLHVCAPQPYYNSPTKKSDEKLYEKVKPEIDEIKSCLSKGDPMKLETRNQWLRGVLDAIFASTFFCEADLWSHTMTIRKPAKED